jgi:hypothetical protein
MTQRTDKKGRTLEYRIGSMWYNDRGCEVYHIERRIDSGKWKLRSGNMELTEAEERIKDPEAYDRYVKGMGTKALLSLGLLGLTGLIIYIVETLT